MKGTEETTAPKRIVTELGTEKCAWNAKSIGHWMMNFGTFNGQQALKAKSSSVTQRHVRRVMTSATAP